MSKIFLVRYFNVVDDWIVKAWPGDPGLRDVQLHFNYIEQSSNWLVNALPIDIGPRNVQLGDVLTGW